MLGTVDDLLPQLTRNSFDVVVIALPWSEAGTIGSLIEKLNRFAIDTIVPLTPRIFDLRFAAVVNIAALHGLQVVRRPLRGSLILIKWLEDYVVATIGLILVSPILLLAAIAIKLEGPGPVLYRQTRVGYNNRLFSVYKLRTMTVDPTDDGSLGTQRDNPRITRCGAWLRRLSIDELPQLINVLKGEMSVVGPRPHVPNMLVGESLRYETLRAYTNRYQMKPGITGWAQINGMRGGINTLEKAMAGIELDLYYVENWSLWLDIKIMLLTVTKGMAGRDVF
ncbi:exopolysaccharide biosynthesis polyprenyl glycosylphosphotransferase [Pseudochelatococcus lubricantis]|uniref:Exopolysaccharide biosynthesis polyprenyl glycosylphosphotransferase n=1 Tax=Pseudochelatococcus lubricantis TaxID=1538102 RepID=A0ABX0V433_9HYPH|nr:exopolysaccharide biosynthesis polyprenyl glycosylphosphotransferase [Pseudochelatococcus lubricantis]